MGTEILSNFVKDPSDLDFIIALAFNSFKAPHGYKSLEDCKQRLEPRLENSSYGLVTAYEDGKPVGFSIHGPIEFFDIICYKLGLSKNGMEYKVNNRNVAMLAVSPRHRRKGIGISLVERIMEDCKEKNTAQLFASCWKGKKGESYYLFKKLGFKNLMTLKGSYLDDSKAILVMKEI